MVTDGDSKNPKSTMECHRSLETIAIFEIAGLKVHADHNFNQHLHGAELNMVVVLIDHCLTGLTFQAASSNEPRMGIPPVEVVNPSYNYFFWAGTTLLPSHRMRSSTFPYQLDWLGVVNFSNIYQQGFRNCGMINQNYFRVGAGY